LAKHRPAELAPKAQYYLGEIDYNRGDYTSAVKNFDMVLEHYPENPKTADARARVFRLRPQSVAAIQAWLDQLQAHWDVQLRSFQQHVEKEERQ